jgi:hypothetical protein
MGMNDEVNLVGLKMGGRLHNALSLPLHFNVQVPNSWAYGGNGKKANNNSLNMYGETFGPGDEIICMLDLDGGGQDGTLSFAKNGILLGLAYKVPKPRNAGQVIFCL